MLFLRFIRVIFLLLVFGGVGVGQDATVPLPISAPVAVERNIPLMVPRETPLEIALDADVHVKKVGQEIHGRLVQPVYAFDRVVLPMGTGVKGRLAAIESLSGKKRTLGILKGDLTPPRQVEVQFTDLQLANGRTIPFQAVVTSGGKSIQLVESKDDAKKKGVQDAAGEQIDQAKQQAREKWNEVMKQVREPGKVHRLKEYAVSQLPVRPQYIRAGTVYFAELQQPLNFGNETITPELVASLGTPPPAGSLVHALLITPVGSATSQKGDAVEAVVAQPLFDGGHLILPQGSLLKGSVVQVRPAHRFHHNGQLRIIFRELVPPDGVQQKVVTGLESVQSPSNDHVKLDSEGGAEATSPKTRYLSTGLSLALTVAAFQQHTDADDVGRDNGGGNGVAGGAAGLKLVGIALGALARSQPLGMAMGAYGSAASVYSHFIAKGRDVTFPKNIPMEISFGSPRKPISDAPEQNPVPKE